MYFMTPNSNSTLKIPPDLFTLSTFGTVGGAAVITWVASGAITGAFGGNVKIIGLVVAMLVAAIGAGLSKPTDLRPYLLVPFNGCLIYLTVVGSTAFTPYLNQKTPSVMASKPDVISPWVPDRNLIHVNKTLQSSLEIQKATLTDVQTRINAMEATLAHPATTGNASAVVAQLQDSRVLINQTQETVNSNANELQRLGVQARPFVKPVKPPRR
jgi:hypothetical protein